MAVESFLLVTDTPSIKQFVFGTDALAEIRGASALLDRLNRQDTETQLRQFLGRRGGRIASVLYANGGSGQFVVQGCRQQDVREAMMALNSHYREKTGGEVKLAFGLSSLAGNDDYQRAARAAHFQMRSQREMAWGNRSASILPFMKECQSASHLAASSPMSWGNERKMLSDASCKKRKASRRAREFGVWAEWMQHLTDDTGQWPEQEAWEFLRCDDFAEIGQQSERTGYIGLIYADGNAMGRLVQDFNSPEVCREFSRIVDDSIREACFIALNSVCRREIVQVSTAVESGEDFQVLPADILLLGGDDLLVLLPADRALRFALEVTDQFERLTRTKIEGLSGEPAAFFSRRLQGRGLTISCGVAIGRATYPFYLLRELAEELMKNAKRSGSDVQGTPQDYWAPAHVDFHLVTGASSHQLKRLRERDYLVKSGVERTLRPLSREQLIQLRDGVHELRQGQFPSSKRHELAAAALIESPVQAQRVVREVFSRCRKDQRRALWEAVRRNCPAGCDMEFPWYQQIGKRSTAIADLVEAFDLFPKKEDV